MKGFIWMSFNAFLWTLAAWFFPEKFCSSGALLCFWCLVWMWGILRCFSQRLWRKRHPPHLASLPWGSKALCGCIWPSAETILRICNTECLGSFIDNINIYIVGSHLRKGFTWVISLNCWAYQEPWFLNNISVIELSQGLKVIF